MRGRAGARPQAVLTLGLGCLAEEREARREQELPEQESGWLP